MSLDLHSRAEDLMAEGDQHAASGNNEAAVDSYRRAAELEAQAFEQVASDKVRTRGVLAVSAVSLFRKAGAADDALRQLHYFLGRGDLPAFANADLTAVLYEMYGEKANEATSSQLSPDTFEWVLRGPRIGIGAAPADAVIEAITHAAKYGIRVYEFLAGLPLRMSGAASTGVLDAFAMQISEPQAGSFRFRVRLGAPAQSVLFEDAKPVTSDALGSAFASILEAATTQDEDNALERVVSDTGYQTAFLRLEIAKMLGMLRP